VEVRTAGHHFEYMRKFWWYSPLWDPGTLRKEGSGFKPSGVQLRNFCQPATLPLSLTLGAFIAQHLVRLGLLLCASKEKRKPPPPPLDWNLPSMDEHHLISYKWNVE
jgi:hypothetical protein